MRMNVPRGRAALALLVLASSAGCGAPARGPAADACPENPARVLRPQGEGWYHGTIVTVDSTGEEVRRSREWSRRLLVQVEPEGRTTGRVWFTVHEGTRVLCRSGDVRARSAPFAPGMAVSAKTGLVMESDPAQAGADTLIVGPP